MKIIHCADLHLDAKMTSNLNKEQAKERKMEILRTFSQMIDYAVENAVRVILIAGDLFDTRSISATVRNVVKDAIIANPQIDFLYLKGNHDSDNFLSKMEDIPKNLKLFNDNWSFFRYGNIVIGGLELNSENSNLLGNSLVLFHETFNIVMLHGQLSDYAGKQDAQTIALSELKNKDIDYLALGHVHSYVKDKLDGRGVYCYSGCLEGRGFDECGKKGFVVLDIDEQSLTCKTEFVSLAARTLYTLEVDVSGVHSTDEAVRKVTEAMEAAGYSSSCLVKVVLTGTVDVECELNTDYMQELFTNNFYLVKVTDATTIAVDYNDYAKDESLKGEFIRMVLAADLDEKKKSEIIRCGLMALSGEEI